MKFDESIGLLHELGIDAWLSNDIEESTRLVVNTVCQHLLDDLTPFDFRPFMPSDDIYEYFNQWEIDWFDLLGNEFLDAVELNMNSIAIAINSSDPIVSVEENERLIESWTIEWRQDARKALDKAIKNSTRNK